MMSLICLIVLIQLSFSFAQLPASCAECASGFGFRGTQKWCGCCALDCSNSKAACIANDGFCETRCMEHGVCDGTTTAVQTTPTRDATTTEAAQTEVQTTEAQSTVVGTTTEQATPAPETTEAVNEATTTEEVGETTESTVVETTEPPTTVATEATTTSPDADCVYTAWLSWLPAICPSCKIDGGVIEAGQSPYGKLTRQRSIEVFGRGNGIPCDQPLTEEKECNTDAPLCRDCWILGNQCDPTDSLYACCDGHDCVPEEPDSAIGTCVARTEAPTTTEPATTEPATEPSTTEEPNLPDTLPPLETRPPTIVRPPVVYAGQPCTLDTDCETPPDIPALTCRDGVCRTELAIEGELCESDADCDQPLRCLSKDSITLVCTALKDNGETCIADAECNSRYCGVVSDDLMQCSQSVQTTVVAALGNPVAQSENDVRLGVGIAVGLCCIISIIILACVCTSRDNDRQGMGA